MKHHGATVNPWKDWELEIVRRFYNDVPSEYIAQFLCNRTGNAVRQKVFDLKRIKIDNVNPIDPDLVVSDKVFEEMF